MTAPLFPGATAVSNLRVYDWEAADHHHGGSPHLHTVSSEAYVVVGGRGEAHTITAQAGEQRSELRQGDLMWFTPGTVHRLVNLDQLEIVTVMQNIGLPEAGDAVLTFPAEILGDPARYLREAALPSARGGGAEAAARRRRDLAVEGYLELIDDLAEIGPDAMRTFIERAEAVVRPRIAGWQRVWARTVESETERTRGHLAALAAGDAGHLMDAEIVRATPRPHRDLGMCGRLHKWQELVDAAAPN